jgi:hypothetical protein
MTVVVTQEYHCYQPTTYKIWSNIPLSSLTPHVAEIIRYHRCGFQRNRSVHILHSLDAGDEIEV